MILISDQIVYLCRRNHDCAERGKTIHQRRGFEEGPGASHV